MRHMAPAPQASDGLLTHDWLGACRRAAEGLQGVLREHPTSTQRVVETGARGEGGDLTLVIDVPLDDPMPERRRRDGKLELVAIESANPRWLAASSDALVNVTGRVRAMGSIAISLCQVAATRVDGMATLWNCRAVDAAAGHLVVREGGGK